MAKGWHGDRAGHAAAARKRRGRALGHGVKILKRKLYNSSMKMVHSPRSRTKSSVMNINKIEKALGVLQRRYIRHVGGIWG
jgi:hypothetical protein